MDIERRKGLVAPTVGKLNVCLNGCLTFQSKAMVMLGCCFHFMGLLPKIRIKQYLDY